MSDKDTIAPKLDEGTEENDARRMTTAARGGRGLAADEVAEGACKAKRMKKATGAALVVGLLSVAVIAVSAAFLFVPGVEGASDTQGIEAAKAASQGADASDSDAPASAADAVGASDAGEGAPAASQDAAAAAGVPSESDARAAPGAQGQTPPAPAPGNGGANAAPAPPSNPTVTVTVSITSSAVGNPVSGGTTATFAPGATAYDALKACGLSVNASSSPLGIYVSAIGGLAEKEHGGTSGWKYAVNGVEPSYSCGSYTLSDGDQVAWYYVLHP